MMPGFLKKLCVLALLLCVGVSCKKIEPGNDPNFTIVKNSDKGFKHFKKKVTVFEIPIYAAYKVNDDRLLHAANILAQYLDNDEDGVVDDKNVYNALLCAHAHLIFWNKESDIRKARHPNESAIGQDLGNEETVPAWHTNGHTGEFDAALEEVWHLITSAGYAAAYPIAFGEYAGTTLCNAMDIARGGQFTSVPSAYPTGAWYTYNDETCEYECMATEYIYWAMTSILGAQENRLTDIQAEWDLNTRSLVENNDPAVYALLTNPAYNIPNVLPDGSYKH